MFGKLCVLVKNSRRLYPHQKSYSTEFTTVCVCVCRLIEKEQTTWLQKTDKDSLLVLWMLVPETYVYPKTKLRRCNWATLEKNKCKTGNNKKTVFFTLIFYSVVFRCGFVSVSVCLFALSPLLSPCRQNRTRPLSFSWPADFTDWMPFLLSDPMEEIYYYELALIQNLSPQIPKAFHHYGKFEKTKI